MRTKSLLGSIIGFGGINFLLILPKLSLLYFFKRTEHMKATNNQCKYHQMSAQLSTIGSPKIVRTLAQTTNTDFKSLTKTTRKSTLISKILHELSTWPSINSQALPSRSSFRFILEQIQQTIHKPPFLKRVHHLRRSKLQCCFNNHQQRNFMRILNQLCYFKYQQQSTKALVKSRSKIKEASMK